MPNNTSLVYRPDIDGLRAVAVASVVAYHAFPMYVRGGFVGVDIFFVISGYLISTILMGELRADRFSLWGFYVRRIQRLFPALIIVLGTTLLLGWFYLLPHEFVSLGKHTAAGAAYVINYVLSAESGYFDTEAETKPLLHLWSLAVEEQFYLIWPLALLAAVRRKHVVVGIAAVTLLSFGANMTSSDGNDPASFFLPQNRIWELSIGALLAAVNIWRDRHSTTLAVAPSVVVREGVWPHVSSLLGFGLIAAAILSFDEEVVYPGVAALVPCLGAALVIAAGANAIVNQRLMALKPVVFLGLISYPLYLWHWPLLSIPTVLGMGDRTSATISAIGLAIILAVGTYLFIEKPLRRRRSSALPFVLLAGTIMLGAIGVTVMQAQLPPRLSAPPHQEVGHAIADRIYRESPAKTNGGGPAAGTHGSARHGILFVGDSHMNQYWPRIDNLLKRLETRKHVRFAIRGGCLPIPGAARNSRGRPDPRCTKLADRAMTIALSAEIETVVIAAGWLFYIDPAAPEEQEKIYLALQGMLRALRDRGKTVWLVQQLPIGPSLAPGASVQRALDGSVNLITPSLERAKFEAASGTMTRRLEEIARAQGAGTINPMDFLCDQDTCRGRLSDGTLMYMDANHLRASVSASQATFIDRILETPGE